MYRPRPTLDAPDQQRQTERDGNVPTSRGGPSAGAFRIGACTSTTVLSVKTSGTVGWNEMGERGYPFKRPSFGGTGDIVLVFLIIGTMAGILIGLRFSVFALIPATLLATVAIIVTDQHGPKIIALTVLGTAVLLQIGYIAGCVVRFYARRYLEGARDRYPIRK